MNRIQRMGALASLAVALIAASAAARADAPPAGAGDASLFAHLIPARGLDAITGMAGISSRAVSDNLVQASATTIRSSVAGVALGNGAFATGGVQSLTFSALGGASAIAINTGIASNQTQSVTVNLAIGAAAGASSLPIRGR